MCRTFGNIHTHNSADPIARAVEDARVPVVAINFDPTVSDDAIHEAQYRRALARIEGQAIIGGFSLAGRIAADRWRHPVIIRYRW